MRKNRKYSKLMIWIMCVFFAVFFAVSYATRSDEKIQAQRLKIIENCKLKQVEATSFDRQNGILTDSPSALATDNRKEAATAFRFCPRSTPAKPAAAKCSKFPPPTDEPWPST